MILLLLYECSLNGVDNQRWWGHSNPTGGGTHTLLAVTIFFNFLHSQVVGT